MPAYNPMMMQRRPPMPVQPAAPVDPYKKRPGMELHDLNRGDIARGRASGVFGPDYLRKFLRNRAVSAFGNQRIRAQQMAQLYGLDPAQSRAGVFQAGQDASRGLSSTLNDADLQGAAQYRDYIQSLMASETGNADDYRRSEQEKADRRFNLGSFGGQVLGAVAGGAAGGLGQRFAGGR